MAEKEAAPIIDHGDDEFHSTDAGASKTYKI